MAAWANSAGSTVVVVVGQGTTTATTPALYLVMEQVHSITNLIGAYVEDREKPSYRPPPGIRSKEVAAPMQLKNRHGFSQMARLPTYRGARTR